MYIISDATSLFILARFMVSTEETRLQTRSEGADVAGIASSFRDSRASTGNLCKVLPPPAKWITIFCSHRHGPLPLVNNQLCLNLIHHFLGIQILTNVNGITNRIQPSKENSGT